MVKRLGLAAGPLAFFLFLAVPLELDGPAKLTAAVALLMAAWWLTEAVPVAVTALLPLVLLPVLGVVGAAEISAPYANKTNMLFLGGLVIATAIERWGLHRRIALGIVLRLGATPARLVLGFMAGTALISVWISNSATTMMMLPIALAVSSQFRRDDPELGRALGPVLLLAVAYSATIGGLGTIVGTPPNAVFAGSFSQLFPDAQPIGFFQWMMVGVPVVLVMVPLAWAYLVYVASPVGRMKAEVDTALIRSELEGLGQMTVPEKRVLVMFTLTALLWMFRRSLDLGTATLPGWSALLPQPGLVGDSTVAIAMAVALFVVPAGDGRGSRLLDWETAVRLPWGVIILLGGGFALAEAIRVSGLALWLGGQMSWVGQAPPLLAVTLLCLFISFATEITTNTAITTIMMPILAASAVAGGCDPLLLMVPCTLAASLCFMMPGGTAPNAIVFSSGDLRVAYMARTGLGLNLLAIIVVVALTWLVAVPVFDISLGGSPDWALP